MLGSVIGAMLLSCGAEVKVEGAVDESKKELSHEVDNVIEESSSNGLFKHEDGRFEINFMKAPKIESQNVPTEVGDIEMVTFMYEKSATEAYMVAYADYPSAIIEASETEELLKGGKSGAAQSLGINEYSEEKEISMHEFPGLHFKGKSANGTYVVYDIYMVNNRLYQIAILRDGSYPSEESISNFNGTFDFYVNK